MPLASSQLQPIKKATVSSYFCHKFSSSYFSGLSKPSLPKFRGNLSPCNFTLFRKALKMNKKNKND